MQFGADVVHRHRLLPPPRPQRGRRARLHPAASCTTASRRCATTRTLYAEKLVREGSLTAEQAKAMYDAFNATLEEAFEAAQSFKPNKADWLEGHWSGLKSAGTGDVVETLHDTAVPLDTLREVGAALCRVPDGFNANPKITRQLEAKKQSIDSGEGIDWATGEALAFGTLLLDGHRVRLSGEDVQRGTFSHRHAVSDRPGEPGRIRAAEQHPRGPGEVRGLQLAAVGIRRARLRLRLFARRPAYADAVGRPVRRLRQWRAGHHRPVHRLAARPSGCACPAW